VARVQTRPTRRADRSPVDQPLGGTSQPKLASRTADRILADVVASGWPVGEVVGSEAALRERYGVSRAVFREAVRIVEHQGVARMRRGPGGGLVVDSPDPSAVIEAVVVYLFFVDARLDEVFEARTVLEEAATELATTRLDDEALATLRGLAEEERTPTMDDPRHLHTLLASLSRSPVLELFVEILNRVMVLYLSDPTVITAPVRGASSNAHLKILDAVLAGDAGLARHRMRRHLEAEAEYLRTRRGSRQSLDPQDAADVSGGTKRAERISSTLFAEVVAAGWPVGASLGSEAELMERFDASRAVFREAVRLLEHHQIAAMRRGRGGGLFVVEPGISAIADTAAIYLEQAGIDPAHLAETRQLVEVAVAELAAERAGDDEAARLHEVLTAEAGARGAAFNDAAHDLHVVLAEITGNRVLELFVRVLARLTKLHQVAESRDGTPMSEVPENVMRAHRAIVDAVVAGDARLAGKRQRRHLAALASWLR